MASGADELVTVGRLTGAWGVQGWVRVHSYTDPPETIFDYQPWFAGTADRPLIVKEWRRAGSRLVACLDGIESPEAAERLKHRELRISRKLMKQPNPGHFYWHDLVGLEVDNLEGRRLGKVAGLITTGAHDVLVIEDAGGEELLIPFVPGHYVIQVDLKGRRIRVDWQPDWT